MIDKENPIIKKDIENIVLEKLNWKKLKNKTILITGGNGFLASYVIKSLLTANNYYNLNTKIICIARNSRSSMSRIKTLIKNSNLKIIYHNLQNPLPKKFPKSNIIIHSASQASPKYFKNSPISTLAPNSVGTYYLLEYAVKCKAEKFLFFSSGEVYGNPLNHSQQIKENDYGYLDPTNLRSCYAESKRMGEAMCIAYSKQFKIHTNIVRPFHTYGPGISLDDGRVFADFVSDVVSKKNIVVRGSGSEKRSFCYISDATTGFLVVLLKGVNREAYNIANPYCEISIKNLAKLLCKIFPHFNLKVRYASLNNQNNYSKSPVSRIIPSIHKIKKKGWRPKTSLKEGFSKTINSLIL